MSKKDTEFKKDLIKKLEDKKLSPNSINLYVRNLELLNNDLPLKNLNFLSKTEDIENKLKFFKPNTVRGYLISIVSCLKLFITNKKFEKIFKHYNDLMLNIAKEIKNNTVVGKLTDEQKMNWLTMEEVTKVFDNLNEKVDKFINNKNINELQYNDLLNLMVLSLYILEEPRRNEYKNCKLVGSYNDSLPIDHNYIDPEKLVFTVYKTYKKYGKQEFLLKPELQKILQKYIKHHPLLKGKLNKNSNVDFLVYSDGNPLTAVNSITRILNRVFDKKIGSSQLRKIYTSDKFGKNSDLEKLKEEQAIVAEKMGHTVATQNNYYIKDDSKVE